MKDYKKSLFIGTTPSVYANSEVPETEWNLPFVSANSIQKSVTLNGCEFLEIAYTKEQTTKAVLIQKQPAFKLIVQKEGESIYGKDEDALTLNAKCYNLYYFPEGNYQVKQKGPKISLYVISIDSGLLKVLAEKNPAVLKQIESIEKTHNLTALWSSCVKLTSAHTNQLSKLKMNSYPEGFKKSFYEAILIELLNDIFTTQLKTNSDKIYQQNTIPKTTNLMHKVQEYLSYNLHRSVTISELAKFAGINTTKLKTDFKSTFQTTVFKHLTGLRMQKALQLLQKSEKSVAQISQEVGYKNPQHFTVAFKKYYGYLPSKIPKT